MDRLSWLITPTSHQVLFALRLCSAMALALYLSMWLQLERPYWAALEVAVMIQPVPGMAVVRGFARAAGTIVAGCVGLAIMGAFAQYYELSAAALALWVAFCALCANLLRNNLSYGFAIAGLLAGLTVLLSHSLGKPPFEVAVARTQEALLAAVITATVNVLFSPPTGIRNYFNSRVELLRALGAELARLAAWPRTATANDTAQDAENPRSALQALAAQAMALENTRRYVRYEAPQFANFDRTARRLDYDLLSYISTLSSLHIYLAGCIGDVDTRPIAALAGPARRLAENPADADGARRAFDAAHEEIRALARQSAAHGRDRSLTDYVVLSRALGLASRGRAAMATHAMLIDERRHPGRHAGRRSEFGQPMDVRHALRNALRTLIAVSLGGVVWVNFHDQLPTVLLMILLSALTTILATTPNPVAAAGLFARGVALAIPSAFVVDFLLMPQANSYATLMLALMPVVFVAGLAMALPDLTLAVPARIWILMFSIMTHVQNGAIVSFTVYFQIAMGVSGAVGLTYLAFKLVLPVSPRQRLREQMHGVFKELAYSGRHTRERFETRMYDRFNNLALSEVETPYRFSARQAVLAAINVGLETRSLVVLIRRLDPPSPLRAAVDAEVDALRALFVGRRPDSIEHIAERARAFHRLAERLIEHATALNSEAERRLGIRTAICAELVAAALTDYVQAFGHGQPPLAVPDTADEPAG